MATHSWETMCTLRPDLFLYAHFDAQTNRLTILRLYIRQLFIQEGDSQQVLWGKLKIYLGDITLLLSYLANKVTINSW